ncbi:MAG: DNA-processing protein DprA [Thermales bacterium]|nr:DNA-processing protein DprA [Thermales bacterium]
MSYIQNNQDRLRFAWLSNNGLTYKRHTQIRQEYEDFYTAYEDDFCRINDEKFVTKFKSLKPKIDKEILKLHNTLMEQDIYLQTLPDKPYPPILRSLNEPPLAIFYQGDISVIYKLPKMITVVGSRDVSEYSKEIMDKILGKICQSGVGVVSGLAYGVDSYSHQICLDNHAPALAVLGMGLDKDIFYPKEVQFLRDRIVDSGGLLLSEYLPTTPGNKFTFPRRNRILANLTPITLVVQAKSESGSMITANEAFDNNKKVATFPAHIGSKGYDGNIELIQKKVIIVTEPKDILGELGVAEVRSKANKIYKDLSEKDIMIVEALKGQIRSVEDLTKDIEGLTFSELMVSLSMLELKGIVKNAGLNQWKVV